MLKTISEKEFIEKLKFTNKELLSPFLGLKKPITVKCLVCNSEPYKIKKAIAVLNSKYCKKCAAKQSNKISGKNFATRCKELGYELLTECSLLYNCPIQVKCNDCGTIKDLAHASTLLKYPNKKCCNSKLFNKYTVAEFNAIIESLGYNSTTLYTSLKEPITIKCKYCKNVKNFLQAKNALNAHCKKCSDVGKKYTLENVKEICIEKGITLLDTKFINGNWYHNFICDKGHLIHKPFFECLRSFKKGFNGCHECNNERKRTDINDIKKQFLERGFEFKSKTYKKFTAKYLTKCLVCEYEWNTTPGCIIHRGSGCPKCNMFYNEKLTGKYLLEMLPNHIALETHKCLKEIIKVGNEIIRKRLYIDYVFEIKNQLYYVEYQGIQHYEPANFGQNDKSEIQKIFEQQQLRDKWLRKYCKIHNIILIEIDGRKLVGESIKNYLLDNIKLT